MTRDEYQKMFGNRVKQRRSELKLSQDELAKRLGYKGRSAVCQIEAGTRSVKQDMINRLALILDMDPLYLIGVSDTDGRITYGEEDPVKEALRCSPRNKLLEYMAIITEELGKR